MNPLRGFWAGLAPRERAVLAGGLAAAVLVLAYAFAWVPWQDALGRLRLQVPAERETLAWMRQAAARAAALRGAAPGASGGLPALTVLERTAEWRGLRERIRQMRPADQGRVRIWLQDVSFDDWLRWLGDLRGRGLVVTAAHVERAGAPGRVSLRMTVARR